MIKRVIVKGPVLTRSGYGEQARFALRSLRSRPDLYDIYIQPLSWGDTSWLSDVSDERKWIDQTIEKTISYIQMGGSFDVSLQVTIPNEFEPLAPINIGYTAGIETTRVAPEWLEVSNQMNKLIVVSNHSKNVFKNSSAVAVNRETNEQIDDYRLEIPVDVVNYPVKKFDDLPEIDLDLDYDFNFLLVSQMGIRKNIPNTVKWFIDEFKNDEVGLIVKTNLAKNSLIDKIHTEKQLSQFINSVDAKNRKCKVYLLHGDMSDEELHSLYLHEKVKAFVSLTHGEGFGLPLFEAAYSGLPVVAPGWSGHLDFLTDENGKEHFYNVSFDIQPVQKEAEWKGVVDPGSMWSFARENSAKDQMRQCYNDVVSGDNDFPCEYAIKLQDRFSEQKLYSDFVNCIESLPNSQEAQVVVL
jgi:glycosyltransferase involved in cell wall biosynthesis